MQINYTLMFRLIFRLMVHNIFIFTFDVYKVHMISNKKTMAVSAIAIAAVIAVFAVTPFVLAHDAQAFIGGGFRHGGFFGRGLGFGGWGGWGGWGGGCCGCGCGGWGW
jgi:hypothetical protein